MTLARLQLFGQRASAYARAILITVFFVTIAVRFGIAFARRLFQVEQLGIAFGFLALSLLLILLIIAHECGHALAAIFFRWRMLLFTAWRLTVKFHPLEIRWGELPFAGAASGAVVALPAKGSIIRSQWVAVLLGGVAVNLVIALVCGALLFVVEPEVWRAFLVLLGSLSLALVISNLVPRRGSISRNDGALLLDAIRGEHLVPREHYTLIFGETIKGKRPRDWSLPLVAAVQDDLNLHPPEAYQYLLLSEWHFDRREFRDARTMLERAKAFDDSGKAFLIPDALLLAIVESDGTKAQELLGQVTPKRARTTFGYWLAMSAASLAVNDHEAARLHCARAESALRRFTLSTEADYDMLASVRSLIDSGTTTSTAMAST